MGSEVNGFRGKEVQGERGSGERGSGGERGGSKKRGCLVYSGNFCLMTWRRWETGRGDRYNVILDRLLISHLLCTILLIKG